MHICLFPSSSPSSHSPIPTIRKRRNNFVYSPEQDITPRVHLSSNYEHQVLNIARFCEELLLSCSLGSLEYFIGSDGAKRSLHISANELKTVDIASVNPSKARKPMLEREVNADGIGEYDLPFFCYTLEV